MVSHYKYGFPNQPNASKVAIILTFVSAASFSASWLPTTAESKQGWCFALSRSLTFSAYTETWGGLPTNSLTMSHRPMQQSSLTLQRTRMLRYIWRSGCHFRFQSGCSPADVTSEIIITQPAESLLTVSLGSEYSWAPQKRVRVGFCIPITVAYARNDERMRSIA